MSKNANVCCGINRLLLKMQSLTLNQARLATNAAITRCDPSACLSDTISEVCTDTRSIARGCLFIAIKGDTHDGHDHVQKAIQGGAVAVMVDHDVDLNAPVLRVDDTRRAMGQLATLVRRSLKQPVIAVAGSNGKTGTKNLLHSVLRGSLTGTLSPKSFNNDIGVPTTIFSAEADEDYLILEIGTNHHGEILNLTKIALPDIAIITNIGAEHLEFLGDLEGVRRENAQIIEGLDPNGLLVINGDSDGLTKAVSAYRGKIITFGVGSDNDLCAEAITCRTDGVRFTVDNKKFFIPLMGRHIAVNALAAIAVARHLGVNDADITAGLAAATGPEMRLQLQTAGAVTILNDAYNANPHSMQAGLETLRDMQTSGRRVAIVGDMRELGQTADHYHRQLGTFAASCEFDQLICIGDKSRLFAASATKAGMRASMVHHYHTAAICAAEISNLISDGDLVLLKASRGIKLESIGNRDSTNRRRRQTEASGCRTRTQDSGASVESR